MDRQAFEIELKREGYDEILTGTTHGPKYNAEHSHPYDVKAMVIDGAITLAWEGQTQTFRPGTSSPWPAAARIPRRSVRKAP